MRLEVVVPVKGHSMTKELDAVRADLRALMTASMLGLPDYWLDSKAVRRVGRLLSDVAVRASQDKRFGRSSAIPSFDELSWRSRFGLH
jgi:hypothetical protein